MNGVTSRFWLALICLLLIFSSAQAKPEFKAPANFIDELEAGMDNAWQAVLAEGWADDLNAPRNSFSSSTLRVETLESGQFLRALVTLKNRGLLDEAQLDEKIELLSQNLLQYQWVPAGTDWGVKQGERVPQGSASFVRENVSGVIGGNLECKDAEVKFNEWYFARGSADYDSSTTIGSNAAAVSGLLAASESLSAGQLKSRALEAAGNSAENMLSLVVTPDGAGFGVEQSILTEEKGGEIPVGMLPWEMQARSNDGDTANCSDGGFIKYQLTYLHEVAEALVAFQKAFELTGDSDYQDAADYIIEGIYSIRECDGLMYSRVKFFTPYAATVKCDLKGGEDFDKYPGNIMADNYAELNFDTALIMYLTQEARPNAYSEINEFKDTLGWVLELEEDYVGSGFARVDGFIFRHASDYVHPDRKPVAKAMLGAMFLRAACQEKNADKKERLAEQAVSQVREAFTEAEVELASKPKHALGTDLGKNLLALQALSEVHEIFTVGCSTAPDLDEDGYYDDPEEEEPDCNDNDDSIFPGAEELCNEIDDDCDSKIDEGFDADEDGFTSCGGDCNDNNALIHPNALERNNRVDDNCNGDIDEMRVLVDSSNLEENILTGAQVSFFLFDNPIDECTDAYDETRLEEILQDCNAFAECTTTPLGACSLQLLPRKYLAIFEDWNGLNARNFDLRVTRLDKIYLRQAMELESGEEEDDLPAPLLVMPSLSEMFNMPADMEPLLQLVVAMMVILLLVAIIVVAFLFYMIKIKPQKEGYTVSRKVRPSSGFFQQSSADDELAEFRGKWSYK